MRLTLLSADHKSVEQTDSTLSQLLDLDGTIADVGGGYWIKMVARTVEPDEGRPFGVAYVLTMHDAAGTRVFGLDNAHPIRVSEGPAGRTRKVNDHRHKGTKTTTYAYSTAEELIVEFWKGVEGILKQEGVP